MDLSLLLGLTVFSLPPIIGALIGYKTARQDEDKLEQAFKGAGWGLLISLLLLCDFLAQFAI